MRDKRGRLHCFITGIRSGLASMCLALTISGCASLTEKGIPLDDPAKRASLIAGIERRYPDRFHAIHRATLTIRGRDVALDGFLRIDGAEYRFVVSTGFGTAFFEIASDANGGDTLIRSDDLLPKDAIQHGAAQDLRAMFLKRPDASAALAVLPDGRLTLTDSARDGSHSVYMFDAATERWLTYTHVNRGRIDRVLHFDDYSEPDANGNSFPRRIRVINSAKRYTVDVRVVTLVPEP